MITTRTGTVPALVLIVEDDPPIADLIAAVVEGAGYEPLVATHGRQGLDLARLRQPALVLTDLMLPYLTGKELIAALHADADAAGRSPAPVIVLTAASAHMARESGADALLTKPFDLAELEGLLHRFLA